MVNLALCAIYSNIEIVGSRVLVFSEVELNSNTTWKVTSINKIWNMSQLAVL